MNHTRRGALALGMATVLGVLGALPAAAQEFVLKLHQMLPAQAPVPSLVLEPWIKKIEAESGGRIKIEHYPAMQLGGKPADLYDQVVDGVADIIWTLPGYTPGRFPQTEVFELPFMMTNAEATSKAFWDLAEKHMLDTDFKDVKVLAVFVHGPGLIHSKSPILSVAELNGVKLRAPTRVTNMMFEALGATAVGMPVPAVPEALSKGVIDATVIPWEVTGAIKSSELVTNHTEFGTDSLYTSTMLIAMNKDTYNSLPDDLKAVIDANSGAAFSAMAGAASQGADAPARKMAEERGNSITVLTPEQVAEWKAAAAPTVDRWVAEAQGFDAKALLDEARAAIAGYSM